MNADPPPVFSQRSAYEAEENAISARKRELLARGRMLLDLTRSNPTAASLAPFESLTDLIGPPGSERYAPHPMGIASARVAISERWRRRGYDVPSERIVLSASTSEAYGFLFKLLCDPGDEVLVPEPSYPLFEHLARLEHCRLVPYRLLYDGAWYIDMDSVTAAIGDKTRAILIVSPNNPTGSIASETELFALANLGLPLICDEVFSEFLFGDAKSRFRSAIGCGSTLVFVLDGLSKSLGLPQCKLGWMSASGPESMVKEALTRLELIGDCYLSVATPVQLALPELLAREPQRHDVIQERLETNRSALHRLTRDSCVTPLHLDGGWSAVLSVPRTRSESDWVLGLLETPGVVVQPGWFFDFPTEGFLVISLLTEPATFAAGIERLCDYVSSVA